MKNLTFFHNFVENVRVGQREGPPQNILAPKYEAREKMKKLRNDVWKVYSHRASTEALEQLCRCLLFSSSTLIDLEEEEKGYQEVLRAYRVMRWCVAGELPSAAEVRTAQPVAEEEVFDPVVASQCRPTAATGFAGCLAYMMTLTTVALYLAKRSVMKARELLDRAESFYDEWDEWWMGTPDGCLGTDIPKDEEGRWIEELVAPSRVASVLRRLDMDNQHGFTLFCLAQTHTNLGNADASARYCQRSLYYTFVRKQNLSKQEWADNALSLSNYYCNTHAYDKAYHCLLAGQKVMPVGSEPRVNAGMTAWFFGLYYLRRLKHYGAVLTGAESAVAAQPPDPAWRNLADLPELEEQPPVKTYAEARECFKTGMAWLREALACRPFELFCTEHISITKDMVHLYAALQTFEPDRARRIAMVQRQTQLLEEFPGKLNSRAYLIVVRELLLDLGTLYGEQVLMRRQQRQHRRPGEKPLADEFINALVRRELDYYKQFCETWRHPKTGVLPDVLEEESRAVFLRVLLRQAQGSLHYLRSSPKEEYDDIGQAYQGFRRVVDFVKLNPLPSEDSFASDEAMRIGLRMMEVLPKKQHELLTAYASRSA
ncbi:KIF-1 binding protein C terminal [Novymonas esmeraldas]|uniref:KIF-binding protein n=1 Tax=Novymonas esmeraldas TaxID=1808958 RepID=A0AAW0ELJ2_9TRYP